MESNNILEEVTKKILLLLDKVVSGDIEHWIPISGLAYNPKSNHTYSSVNQLLLSLEMVERKYSHNVWLTYKQLRELGGQVIEGEHAYPVTFSEVLYFNEKGEKITPQGAKQLFAEMQERDPSIVSYLQAGIRTQRFLKYYNVFNVAQTVDIPEALYMQDIEKLSADDRNEQAENVLIKCGVIIRHSRGNSAHYSIDKDAIQMPFTKQFKSIESYYATLFHEVVHWSGHETRLNRTFGIFGSPEYAFEELIAELGGAFICAQLQIPASIKSTTAYIKSWLTALQNDRMYLLKAVGYSERAMNYVLKNETVNA